LSVFQCLSVSQCLYASPFLTNFYESRRVFGFIRLPSMEEKWSLYKKRQKDRVSHRNIFTRTVVLSDLPICPLSYAQWTVFTTKLLSCQRDKEISQCGCSVSFSHRQLLLENQNDSPISEWANMCVF